MVMQWTVNPPPSGTTGSIPVISTKFRSVRIEVITVDCLSTYGGSIPPQTAKVIAGRVRSPAWSHKPLPSLVQIQAPQPFLSVRNLGYRESCLESIKGRKPLIFDDYRSYSSRVVDQDIQSGRSSKADDTPCLLDKQSATVCRGQPSLTFVDQNSPSSFLIKICNGGGEAQRSGLQIRKTVSSNLTRCSI